MSENLSAFGVDHGAGEIAKAFKMPGTFKPAGAAGGAHKGPSNPAQAFAAGKAKMGGAVAGLKTQTAKTPMGQRAGQAMSNRGVQAGAAAGAGGYAGFKVGQGTAKPKQPGVR